MAGWNEGGGFEAEASEAPPPIAETPIPEAKVEAPSADSMPEAAAQPFVETASNETNAFSEAPQPEANSIELPGPETEVAAVEPPSLDANEGQFKTGITPAEAAAPEPTDLPPVDSLDVADPHIGTSIEPETLAPTDAGFTNAQLADMAGMDHDQFSNIVAQKNGSRPSPEGPGGYLSPEYVEQHLRQFDTTFRDESGQDHTTMTADRVIDQKVDENGKSMITKWGLSRDDGWVYVSPTGTPADQRSLENNEGPKQTITMSGLENATVEMPDGNEMSATEDWRPGGHALAGAPEVKVNIGERPVARMIDEVFEIERKPHDE